MNQEVPSTVLSMLTTEKIQLLTCTYLRHMFKAYALIGGYHGKSSENF